MGTRHQTGCNLSLLDLFLSNIPERASGVRNFYNAMSEHEGVMCTLLTKTPIMPAKSMLLRDYRLATFEVMQPMVDASDKLQSLFSDSDPEIIAQKLVNGIKEITDRVINKKRVQAKKRGYEYWNEELETERKKVAALHKIAISTKSTDDIRNHKNAKNQHTKKY